MTKTKGQDTDMTTKTIEQLEDQAHALAAHGRELAISAELLERRLRMARGTADLSTAAKIARRPTPANPKRPVGTYTAREPDETSTSELYTKIKQLVTESPKRFRELVDATQAGENRIKGVLMRLQRDEAGLVNLGNQRFALWFIPDAKLLVRLRNLKRR